MIVFEFTWWFKVFVLFSWSLHFGFAFACVRMISYCGFVGDVCWVLSSFASWVGLGCYALLFVGFKVDVVCCIVFLVSSFV